jgi:hypothetical protein
MARPIKDTPLLSGKDWNRLEKAMAKVKPLSKKEREEQRKAYEWAKSIATFPMP